MSKVEILNSVDHGDLKIITERSEASGDGYMCVGNAMRVRVVRIIADVCARANRWCDSVHKAQGAGFVVGHRWLGRGAKLRLQHMCDWCHDCVRVWLCAHACAVGWLPVCVVLCVLCVVCV